MKTVLVHGGLPIVIEVTDRYNVDNNNKNNPVVDTEDRRLIMNVYMKEYENHMRDLRQWKVNDRNIQPCAQAQ